ncbi:MAG: hypothetical protein WCF22_07835 [Candidatus Sulfotelmatobacter sp.]
MKRILFAATFGILLLTQNAYPQEAVWPAINNVTLASDPISGHPLVSIGSYTGNVITAVQNCVICAAGYAISGVLSGDLGQPTGGPSQSVLSFPCTTTGPQLVSYNSYSPGVHVVYVLLTICNGLAAGESFHGQLIIIVPPPGPQTTPPGPGCTPNLIDPVRSNLLRGPAITSSWPLLASSSNISVIGASADGASQVLLTIPANHIGDELQLNIINDASGPSSSTDQDGGLMQLGGNPSSLSSTLNLAAVDPGTGQATAFAIYVPPSNYARGTQEFPQDNASAQRQVSFQVFCPASNDTIANPTTTPVTIVRPPIVLVHGLWADWSAWDSFAPTSGSDEAQLWSSLVPNASFFAINYAQPVSVSSTTPSYSPQLQTVSGSALGFAYNAQVAVLPAIQTDISTFATDFDVAVVQADVIAHSMGGNITRFMPLLDQQGQPPAFLTPNTYGKGPVEKLITIGTPHLGSPLAIDLLPSGQTDSNACVRRALTNNRNVSLQSATLVSGGTWPGGVGDLSGDGQDTNGASVALQAIQNAQATQPFPMAYISAQTSSANLAGLSCSNPLCNSNQLYVACYLRPFTGDPLAADLRPNSWNSIFNNQANDGIVPLTSQLNGQSSPSGSIPTLSNDIHSQGLLTLDFLGPYELEDGVIGIQAIDLLNEGKGGTDFQY